MRLLHHIHAAAAPFSCVGGRAHSRVALVPQGSDKRIDALSSLCQRIASLVRPVSDKPAPVPLITQPRVGKFP